MSAAAWEYDDATVPDSELLYRRIPRRPEHRTFDSELDRWVPHPGALRREANEGMSVHMHSVLDQRGRDPQSLYDSSKYGSIAFPAGIPRCEDAGVLPTTPAEDQETDPDLRASHAEIRPPTPEKNRAAWSRVTSRIITHAMWVQPAE